MAQYPEEYRTNNVKSCALLFCYCSEEGNLMYMEAHAFDLRFARSPYTRHRHGNRLRDGSPSLKHWKIPFQETSNRCLRLKPRISCC